MKLLAIDTSSDACSVALIIEGEILSKIRIAPRRHAEILLPMLDALLLEAGISMSQIDALAMGAGPGAFTGLRIAAGVVQGLAFSTDIPVVMISTLTALAQRGWREQSADHVLAALDARLKEVYWSACTLNRDNIMLPVTQEIVCNPAEVPIPEANAWLGLGSAWQVYNEALSLKLGNCCQRWMGDFTSHAHDVALLGEYGFNLGHAVSAEQVIPVYIRNDVAKKPSKLRKK